MFSTQAPRVQPTAGEQSRPAVPAPARFVIMQKGAARAVQPRPFLHDHDTRVRALLADLLD